jgi:hypothetical protein
MKKLGLLAAGFAWLTAAPFLPAQEWVLGKVFVIGVDGEVRATQEGRILPLRAGDTFFAKDLVFSSADDARASMVLSNQTGLFLAAGTRIEFSRFEQAPFIADPSRLDEEPSVSRLDATLYSGSVALCFSTPVFGSVATLRASGALCSVRGGQVVFDVSDELAVLHVVTGQATVRAGPDDVIGLLVNPGESASIWVGPARLAPVVEIETTSPDTSDRLSEMLASACLSRRAVFFAAPEQPRRVLPLPEVDPTPTTSIDRLGR